MPVWTVQKYFRAGRWSWGEANYQPLMRQGSLQDTSRAGSSRPCTRWCREQHLREKCHALWRDKGTTAHSADLKQFRTMTQLLIMTFSVTCLQIDGKSERTREWIRGRHIKQFSPTAQLHIFQSVSLGAGTFCWIWLSQRSELVKFHKNGSLWVADMPV